MIKRPHASILITGTLTERDDANPLLRRKYVYQRTQVGHGQYALSTNRDLQRRRHVTPVDPRTELQVQRRTNFAHAILAWRATTPAQRQALTKLGHAAALPAYQFFISRFLKSEPLPPIISQMKPAVALTNSGVSPIFSGSSIVSVAPAKTSINLAKFFRP